MPPPDLAAEAGRRRMVSPTGQPSPQSAPRSHSCPSRTPLQDLLEGTGECAGVAPAVRVVREGSAELKQRAAERADRETGRVPHGVADRCVASARQLNML